MPSSPITIRPLQLSDDRANFRSGNDELDVFFHRYAGQNQFLRHIGVSYIALQNGQILGFYTVSAGHLTFDELPQPMQKKLPRYPVPILRLARLAVDEKSRGKAIGSLLLRDAMLRALTMAESIGCAAIVVDAKAEAVPFYEKFGFASFGAVEGLSGTRPLPVSMLLPLSAIRAGLANRQS